MSADMEGKQVLSACGDAQAGNAQEVRHDQGRSAKTNSSRAVHGSAIAARRGDVKIINGKRVSLGGGVAAKDLAQNGRTTNINYLKRPTYLMLAFGLLLSATPFREAKACTDPPPSTVLRIIIINVGPPLRITLVFDPWTTFAAAPSQFCSCGFRFPTALIDTLDEVRLVETGTNILVPGFDIWGSNATTSAEIENILGAGAGNDWIGFLNDVDNVPAGIEADFQVDVTLEPGVTVNDLIGTLQADPANLVFTDEADSSGAPLGTHPGFVDVSAIIPPTSGIPTVSECIPTASEWGLVVMTLSVLTAGAIMLVRRRQGEIPV